MTDCEHEYILFDNRRVPKSETELCGTCPDCGLRGHVLSLDTEFDDGPHCERCGVTMKIPIVEIEAKLKNGIRIGDTCGHENVGIWDGETQTWYCVGCWYMDPSMKKFGREELITRTVERMKNPEFRERVRAARNVRLGLPN